MRQKQTPQRRFGRRHIAATAIICGAVALLGAALFPARDGQKLTSDAVLASQAQGAATDPAGTGGQVHNHPGRPAHIYSGRCDNLGEVAFALNPVGAGTMTGGAGADAPSMAIGEIVGAASALPVEIGTITLDVPLAEITAGEYALNVQISEYDYGNVVACGDVGGAVANNTLTFGLAERNTSGISGVAVLAGEDDRTRVTVYLAQQLNGQATPTAAAA